MSLSEASQQRYSTHWQQAAYLESEWSDILLGVSSPSSDADPLNGMAGPTFYRGVARLTEGWAKNGPTKKCCDVGGATGRTLYELAGRLESLDECVLAEPSPHLATWARKLLLDPKEIDWIPVVSDWQKCGWAQAKQRPETRFGNGKQAFVYEAHSDDVPRPTGYFDVVTSLNVVDRVPEPRDFLRSLRDLLRPGGLLVLASPLQFDERFTPRRESWVTDLNELVDPKSWDHVGDDNVLYDIRRYRREWIRYRSQVLALTKKS